MVAELRVSCCCSCLRDRLSWNINRQTAAVPALANNDMQRLSVMCIVAVETEVARIEKVLNKHAF